MTSIRMPRVDVDLKPYYKGEESGHSKKTLIVCHETVSYNTPGVMDIKNPAAFLDSRGLEIHGIIDSEGNSGWSYDPTAIYDHAASGNGMVNTRSIGFELVSEIPLSPSLLRYNAWLKRRNQLDKLAKWIVYLYASGVSAGAEGNQKIDFPLQYSDGTVPGITTHWDVSKSYLGGHGHWDCWPKQKGGYFPILYVVQKARNYYRNGGW